MISKLWLRQATMMACLLSPLYAQARPCVEGVCLGDSISAVTRFSYEPVQSFGRPLSAKKQQKLRATYPKYPAELAVPLSQGRFDNRVLATLPRINKVCAPASVTGKTIKQSGLQTQFTLTPDIKGTWKVTAITQTFAAAERETLKNLISELDNKYKEYSMTNPNRVATYLFIPSPSAPYFVLHLPLPNKESIIKYQENCTR